MEIKEVDDFLLSLNPPSDFATNSPNNVIRNMEKSFETLVATMEDAGIHRPKDLSVFEFYSRLDYLESKRKKAAK